MRGSIKLPLWSHTSGSQHARIPLTNSLSDDIGSIKGNLSSICRREFLQICWDFHLSEAEWSKVEKRFDSYFSTYEEFCQVDRPYVLTTCSHEALCQWARGLLTGDREHVETYLINSLSTPANIARDAKSVVEFIGKAILRIDLTHWKDDETVHAYIDRTLGVVSKQTDHDRLPPSLNAATFSEKAGIRILWQPDISSHLNIAHGDTTLKIFHDVAVLDLLESGPFKDVLPPNFIKETRRTVDLLLPKSEPRCRHWLERELQSTKLGISMTESASDGVVDRNLQTFDFWRDRLIVARDVFETSQPKGLRQLIRDDRNKVQYWTFWIAITVFWLTLGGFVTGCLQTYKAYHPSPQPPWLGPGT